MQVVLGGVDRFRAVERLLWPGTEVRVSGYCRSAATTFDQAAPPTNSRMLGYTGQNSGFADLGV